MATEPMKSPSKHNFSFPHLKWGHKNQVNNGHRFGKSPESVSEVPSPNTHHPEGRNRFPLLPCSAEKQGEESSGRQWNLRPRKVVPVDDDDDQMIQMTENQPKSMRLRGLMAEGYGVDRRVKRKFWIALSKEEIEEDIYAMTGLRPSRRPKKRPKNVQKQLDNVFPGLHFVGLSSDAYTLR